MAEGAESDNSSINKKPATDRVWNFKLFQNIPMATSLSCIECGHPPKKCFVDNNNQTLCEICADPLLQKGDKIIANPYADSLIANNEIICPNILFDPSNADDEKKEEEKQCETKCLVKDWSQHNDVKCEYTIVDCANCHSDFTASRCLQAEHNKTCGYVTIKCPQSCGHDILRKDTEKHIKDDCAKTILDCSNIGCADKIARELHTQHVNQCPKRIVQCEYRAYGCTQLDVKYEDMTAHMQQFEIKHLQFHLKSLYRLVQQQQQVSDQAGMIRMFAGGMRTVPNGWILCDGQNGAPDLRKMFVVRNSKHPNDDFDVDQISECEMKDAYDEDDNQYNKEDDQNVSPFYSMIYIMKV